MRIDFRQLNFLFLFKKSVIIIIIIINIIIIIVIMSIVISFYFIMYTDILHIIRILSISQFCLRELLRSLLFFFFYLHSLL